MFKAWQHFKTITKHRHLVMGYCFRLGMYKQGLLHDLSKYSPIEFMTGVKYWTGVESPNNGERRATGLSLAWLHHKGVNKHHLEYWLDYSSDRNAKYPIEGMKMPIKYVVEMFVDRVCACRNYMGESYTNRAALEYYLRGRAFNIMHPDTAELLEKMLTLLAERGEEYTLKYIKENILTRKGSDYGKGYEDFV